MLQGFERLAIACVLAEPKHNTNLTAIALLH